MGSVKDSDKDPGSNTPDENKSGQRKRGLGAQLTNGFELAAGMGLGAVVGTYIDHHHATAPWGLLAGVGVGFAAGIYLLVKDVVRVNKR